MPRGARSATTAALVLRQARRRCGGLADLALDAGAAPARVEAAAAFAGRALTFAVSGAGAAIDTATGVVTIATDQSAMTNGSP